MTLGNNIFATARDCTPASTGYVLKRIYAAVMHMAAVSAGRGQVPMHARISIQLQYVAKVVSYGCATMSGTFLPA